MSARAALTIAGSDPSGGAGIQADLKTFSALGIYGTAVITALTAQNTLGVQDVHMTPPAFVAQQLDVLVADIRLDAVKIGMLGTAEIAEAVGRFLRRENPPVVVLDPVMVATSGDRLLTDDAVAALKGLLPLASLITPNLPEAAALLGTPIAPDLRAMRTQAAQLLVLGAQRVLLKGGHLDSADESIDVYAGPEGGFDLTGPRIATVNTHGTGCSLSSALAALRLTSPDWPTAARAAKRWLTGALAAADSLQIGHGHGPVHHFYEWWDRDLH
jgi:hydroxymethylpyrimidine/phosphomethylpyrimidine kinase